MTTPATADTNTAEHRGTSHAPISMIERMTVILDAFDPHTPSLSLLDLADRTGLPRSTLHRILDQMIRLRWLTHSTGGYRLGMRPLELGGRAAGHSEIRDIVTPLLHEMCRRTGLAGHLAVLDGREVVFLDKAGGRPAARLPTRLGARLPAHTTAVGKAILATLEPGLVDSAYRGALPLSTARSLRTAADLRQELARIRGREGLAVDNEETLSGIRCIAAPLRGCGPATAALSLCGDQQAVDFKELAPLVHDLAGEARRALFPRLGGQRTG
ncbi:IclR family transcriptional regulator [Streptomyces endophyticus]|uniref:IclR family transcriptional regulator n=1 Tax=Streptomyces endophyticus TaxID=714166 RepID=A0ABU6EWK4_9ACTN|nr:IclR family transcriptional regulator [Streptomyces endophyticus]MEB8336123.1 IclR family transcriptional regulator [Streptomyces endophyticus]